MQKQSYLVSLGYVADERGMVIAKDIYDFERACEIARAERDKQREKRNTYAVVRVFTHRASSPLANCHVDSSFGGLLL